MKNRPAFYSELFELFKKPLPDHRPWEDVNFVVYFVDEKNGQDSSRHKYFKSNQGRSEKFLKKALNELSLSVTAFDTVLAKIGEEKYPNIKEALERVRQIQQEFKYLDSIDNPLVDVVPTPGEAYSLYFSYKVTEGHEDRNDLIYEAICDYFSLLFIPFSSVNPSELDMPATNSDQSTEKSNGIFANFKDIDISREFGIPKSVSDGLSKVIKHANHERALTQFKESRVAVFKTSGQTPTELTVDATALSIKAAEQFANQLMRIKDAKILQTFCALWKYANLQNSFQFRDVPISDVMEIVLKKNNKTNFSVEDRKHFTQALEYLAAITITLQIQTEQVNKKGKKRTVLQEEKGVKMFRMVSTYALKRVHQNVPKEELDNDIHFDKEVITRFSGELLPDYNRDFRGRSSIYHDALLRMDAGRDQKAVVLGFALQTRFNQLQNKCQPVYLERAYLIELCDYQKTDQAKAAVATQQIRKVLEKLKTNGLISDYSNLTNNNAEKVTIHPPIDAKAKALN